jgi:cell wall-associated NlpC family hydrolase
MAAAALTGITALPAPSAGAQEATATSPAAADAARVVAGRRAAEHRRLTELTRERDAALAAFFASNAQAARVAPVLQEAVAKLGRPYVRGGAGPSVFDCSGFTRWVWQAAGVSLGHYTGAQWDQVQHISIDELQPGDLVFYWSGGQRGDPGHVGLYVGDGQMIHAPGTGRSVRYESIWYWSGATVAAGRVG